MVCDMYAGSVEIRGTFVVAVPQQTKYEPVNLKEGVEATRSTGSPGLAARLCPCLASGARTLHVKLVDEAPHALLVVAQPQAHRHVLGKRHGHDAVLLFGAVWCL